VTAQRQRVRIPADVERDDRLLGNLTARQLAILAVTGVVLWGVYTATRHVLPPIAFGAVAAPVGALSVMIALGRFEGVSADRALVAAWRHRRSPRRLVPAPDGVPDVPSFIGIDSTDDPAALRLPVAGVADDGIIDLGPDGLALVCRAAAVTFSLRTPVEQEALVAAFARWLNAVADPVEIVVRAETVDLGAFIAELLDSAPRLPHPGLESAAREHAAFLRSLGTDRDLLRRQVLVVLRQPAGEGASGRLHRRAAEAAASLAGAGVSLSTLDGQAATACLAGAVDPFAPVGRGFDAGGVVTSRPTPRTAPAVPVAS
jgi:hypothetical protein